MYMKELEPDEEKAIIDREAELIVNNNFETAAILFLETFKFAAYMGGTFARVFLAPILPLLGEKAYDYISVYEKRENIERLLDKIKEGQLKKSKNKKRDDDNKKQTGQKT